MKKYLLKNDTVIENNTDNIIWKGNLANIVYKRLISGSGFLGNTPTFFCQTLK